MPFNQKKYHVTLTFTEDMLGTCPANTDVYSQHIATKKYKEQLKAEKAEAREAAQTAVAELVEEETKLLPPETAERPTVFRRDSDGKLILLDHMIRGFLKEAAKAISGTWGINGKIDRWLFVSPRRIPVMRDGKAILAADDELQRPLRAETPQGPRVTVTGSEVIKAGAQVSFDLILFPLGQDPKKGGIDQATIESWLDYGAFTGIGQWRSGSFGRFTYTLTEK